MRWATIRESAFLLTGLVSISFLVVGPDVFQFPALAAPLFALSGFGLGIVVSSGVSMMFGVVIERFGERIN